MHLARRGGHRSDKRIAPGDVAGYIHGNRNSLKERALHHAKPPQKANAKYKPKASGPNGGIPNMGKNQMFPGAALWEHPFWGNAEIGAESTEDCTKSNSNANIAKMGAPLKHPTAKPSQVSGDHHLGKRSTWLPSD